MGRTTPRLGLYVNRLLILTFIKTYNNLVYFVARKYDARNANKSDTLLTAETFIYIHRNQAKAEPLGRQTDTSTATTTDRLGLYSM